MFADPTPREKQLKGTAPKPAGQKPPIQPNRYARSEIDNTTYKTKEEIRSAWVNATHALVM